LAAYVLQKATGSSGQMTLSLQISNAASQSADMSTVTLRYWYQDEALGTASLEVDYASVGDSNDIKSKVHSTVVAASSPAPGADHYLEISFTGVTLSPKGTTGNADLLTINGRLHNSGFQGAVDVTNDYSYDAGVTGLDDKITLYQGGKLISGKAP
jgi:endo-1,4-beta-xylanase